MANSRDVVKQIEEFLDGEISLEELEDWSASFAHDAYANQDAESQEAARFLRSVLNAYSDDLSESGLRKELKSIVRPFHSHSEAMRAMVVPERSNRAVMAKAAVALLLVVPATVPDLCLHQQAARVVDSTSSDARTAPSKASEPAVEQVEV